MNRLEMPPILFGIETEVGAAVTHRGERNASPPRCEVVRSLLGYLGTQVLPGMAHVGSPANMYHANAWRTYIDLGDLMELASGESATIEEAITQDHGMEKTIYELFAEGHAQGLYDETFAVGYRALHINRVRGCLHNVTSIGRHQSFGFPRGNVDISPESLATFGAMAATRPLLLGTGAVLLPDVFQAIRTEDEVHPGTTVFSLSQKMPVIYDDFSSATTRNRPVVNLRDASNAAQEYVRVHDASSEHTPSPWAKRMGLGMGAVALTLTHFEMPLPDRVIADMGQLHTFGRAVAFDLTRPGSFETGEATKQAIAVQRRLLDQGKKLSDKVALSDDLLWTMAEWERALEDFEENPLNLIDRTDWVGKQAMLIKYVKANRGRTWDDTTLEDKDRQWDNMGPKGFARIMRANKWAQWMPSQAAIERARHQPVQSSRARVRGEIIGALANTQIEVLPAWDQLWVSDYCRVDLSNPYDTGPQNIAGWVSEILASVRSRKNEQEYVYQQGRATKRRARNEARTRSRPRR